MTPMQNNDTIYYKYTYNSYGRFFVVDTIKVLVADSDMDFAERVSYALKPYSGIEIIDMVNNGEDALRKIANVEPDLVLFDLVLPKIDGLSLLQRINEMPHPPATICCTRFYSDVSLEAVRMYKASYVLYKPIDMQALHNVIHSCYAFHCNLRKNDALLLDNAQDTAKNMILIRNYIVSLGISSKLIGCNYLTEAVRIARMDLSMMRNLSKGLYLEIARSMDTTPLRIERCIRNAIATAYSSGRLDPRLISCPSNKEFINFVLRTIQI